MDAPPSPFGRSRERYRRAALTTAASLAARLATLAVSLAVTPVCLAHLGVERYGLCSTLLSVIMLGSALDLGLGNALMNTVTHAHTSRDQAAIGRFVSAAFFLAVAFSGLVALALALPFRSIGWAAVFSASPTVASAVTPALAAALALVLVGLPLGLLPRLHLGLQEGYVAWILQGAGALIGQIGVLLALRAAFPLAVVVACLGGGAALGGALNLILLVLWPGRRWLLPRVRRFTARAARDLMDTGFVFQSLQLLAALLVASDNIIVTRVQGLAAVPQLSVPAQLFTIIGSGASLLLAPLWPAYRDALSRGELAWARTAYRRSMTAAVLLTGLASACLVWCGERVVARWTHQAIHVDRKLLTGLGLWLILTNVGGAAAMLLNAAGDIRFQLVLAAVMVPAVLCLKTLGCRHFGVLGVAWGGLAPYALLTVGPLLWRSRRLLAAPAGSMRI